MPEEAGCEAADQYPVRPGLEGLCGRGGLHADGRRLPHADGAASRDGPESQASLPYLPAVWALPGRASSPRVPLISSVYRFSCYLLVEHDRILSTVQAFMASESLFFFSKPTHTV